MELPFAQMGVEVMMGEAAGLRNMNEGRGAQLCYQSSHSLTPHDLYTETAMFLMQPGKVFYCTATIEYSSF